MIEKGMKNRVAISTLFRFGFLILLCLTECKKKNVTVDPLSQLPPLTTKGLNTFGCLVNGHVCIPQRPSGELFYDPPYACSLYYYSDTAKPYRFLVLGSDKPDYCGSTSVSISLDSVHMKTGDVFDLTAWRDSTGIGLAGKKYGECFVAPTCPVPSFKFYYTTDTVRGQITIVLLDLVKQIASGTFWFDAIFAPGDTVHVTDGRFDMHYTN